MPVQIFVSYARDDDIPPPGREEQKGFVTYLDEQLRYELTGLGAPQPRLWRDKRLIDAGAQFSQLIADGIAESEWLVVVLSRSWPARPWCLKELELFRARWSSDAEAQAHIVVVGRNHVLADNIPPLLQGQEGYRFFELDRENEAGQEHEFFQRGRVVDPRYETRVAELSRYLWRMAARQQEPAAPPESKAKPAAAAAAAKPAVAAKGRTIYLAKPAADLRLAYDRLVKELSAAGYAVTPPPELDIPPEGAGTFVDEALAAADLSVHLLGERPGFAPDGATPIVQFQLAQAAERAAAGEGFRRILWAPRFLGDAGQTVERDPLEVVARFDRQLDGDTVVGDNLSAFTEFLIQHLQRSNSSAQVLGPVAEGASVYVYHRPEDEDYALELAVALQQRKLNPVLPALDGKPEELEHFHHETLRECQAVVLCWGTASEVWARTTCREWQNWEKLGRREKFAVRGLVMGPPPNGRKSVLLKLRPPDEIDLVLDLTMIDAFSPESLDPLIGAVAADPL